MRKHKPEPATILGHNDNIPIVACNSALRPQSAARPNGKQYWAITFVCPWCGRRHYHGGGTEEERPEGGHRVGHCRGNGAPRSYYLKITETIDPSE